MCHQFFWRPKSQGSPLIMKNLKSCRIVELDSSKKGFNALYLTQKSKLSANYCFWKNLKKKRQTILILKKWYFLAVFLHFIRNGTLQRAEVFCVAFSSSKPFFWAIYRVDRYSCHPWHGGSSWTLFFFFTPFLGLCFLGGGKNSGPTCKSTIWQLFKFFTIRGDPCDFRRPKDWWHA